MMHNDKMRFNSFSGFPPFMFSFNYHANNLTIYK